MSVALKYKTGSSVTASSKRLQVGPEVLFNATSLINFPVTSINPQNTVEVTDPLGQRGTVLKQTTTNTDIVAPNTAPETNQFSLPIIADDTEYWIAYSFMYPSTNPSCAGSDIWPSADYKWNEVFEIHGSPFGGAGPLNMKVGAFITGQEHLVWQRTSNAPYHNDIPWSAAVPYDTWTDVIWHFTFGTNKVVELWVNNISQTFFSASQPVVRNPDGRSTSTQITMDIKQSGINDAGNNKAYIQCYHKETLGTATVYHDYLKIGSSKQAVSG